MKKRKAPVLLVTLLVLLVGGVVVYGMQSNTPSKPDQPTDAVGKEGTAPSSQELKTSIQSNTPNHPTPQRVGDDGKPAVSGGPSIAMPDMRGAYPKPKPSPDGSTSSQWYAKPIEASR